MSTFLMPALGADMEAGTLVSWAKQAGDHVSRGDIIAVVDTEKGAIEIEVFEDGVVADILVQPGTRVPVGTPLAVIAGGETPADIGLAAGPAEPAGTAAPPPAPAPPSLAAATPSEPRRLTRVKASPAARRRAADLGVDLTAIAGTGPDGAVTLMDVERAAAPAAPVVPGPGPPVTPIATPPVTRIPLVEPVRPETPGPSPAASMRRAIAAAMAKSKREIPHAYVSESIDLGRALDWLTARNAARPVDARVLPAALLLKAVAHGLAEVPELNGFWTEGRFVPGPGVHVGCAVFLRGGGLVAPALHDVQSKDLDAVMRGLAALVDRARAGTLRSSELTDATITVTNLGDRGVESVLPIIYPPQVAIVGFGRIATRPFVRGGAVVAAPVVTASVAFDHRAVDGHRAGVFLAAVERRLQAPETL
jgi:pyruvate dehydrogenase E2 component (dihydrolipoamide acetyltransferase)